MARARNFKPDVLLDENLAACAMAARWLFVGMWTIADRAGRLEDRPKRIKAAVLPHDSLDVEPLLTQLTEQGLIRRYEVSGSRYVQILEWEKNQSPHMKESASTIPAPTGPGGSTVQAPTLPVQVTDKDRSSTSLAALTSDSLSLTSDSLSLIPDSIPADKSAAGKPAVGNAGADAIFSFGLPLLTAAGINDRHARSFLGGRRKDYGDEAVIEKLRACAEEKPLQPLEWLAAALPPRKASDKHSGFASKDYRKGVAQDGTII
jgi:hypothetical protein